MQLYAQQWSSFVDENATLKTLVSQEMCAGISSTHATEPDSITFHDLPTVKNSQQKSSPEYEYFYSTTFWSGYSLMSRLMLYNRALY